MLLGPVAFGAAAQMPAATDGQPEAALTERVRSLVGPQMQLPLDAQGQPQGSARVEVEFGKLDPRLRLAPCRRIEPQLPVNAVLWGRTHIGLRCVEGEKPWQVWLPIQVKVMAPALVALQALPIGTVLQASHLEKIEIDWAADRRAPFLHADDLIGRTLTRALQPGQAPRQGELRQRQWFAAGDTVQVLARGAGFSASGEGLALSTGFEGQAVRVRTESGRVLTGMPVGPRRVELTL